MKIIATSFTLALSLLLSLSTTSRAEVSFSISPIRVELSGEVGGTYNDVIEVSNEGKEKVRIKVGIQDWYITEEGTPVFQKAGTQPRSLSSWLKINPVDFLLQPGEKKIVRYSVITPLGSQTGGYWGAFVFETVPQVEPGQKARAVAIKGNIASILYFTLGKPAPLGELTNMTFIQTPTNGNISTAIKNNGNVFFRLKGEIKISDQTGKMLQTLKLPDAPVLAGATRTFPVDLKEKLPPGTYSAVATVDVGMKSLLAGEISFVIK